MKKKCYICEVIYNIKKGCNSRNCHPDDRKDLEPSRTKMLRFAQHDKRRTKILRFAQYDINSLLSS